jgi:hypothetical protein
LPTSVRVAIPKKAATVKNWLGNGKLTMIRHY